MDKSKIIAGQILDQLTGEAYEFLNRLEMQASEAAGKGNYQVAATRQATARGVDMMLARIRAKNQSLEN